MVKVSDKFFVCAHCGSEGFMDSSTVDPSCPRCGARLKTPSNKLYSTPNYLFSQRQILFDRMEKANLIPGERTWQEKSAEVENNLTKWLRDAPEKDRIAALEDARMYLSNIIYTDTSREAMSHIIKTAKAMGELAKTLEKYFADGGSRYDREVRCIRPYLGDDDGGQESAASGRTEGGGYS